MCRSGGALAKVTYLTAFRRVGGVRGRVISLRLKGGLVQNAFDTAERRGGFKRSAQSADPSRWSGGLGSVCLWVCGSEGSVGLRGLRV